jgi:RNA polymerase sigma-70 factor (ECF subfamily)
MEMEALITTNTPVLTRNALIGIYERHSTPLYRYAYRMLGDRELAEDCVSETFSRFLSAIRDRGGPIENVRAYLYRVAHNWVTDHYRRRQNALVPLEVEFSTDPEDHPGSQYAREQERSQVRAALFSLPDDQRRVIELRFLEEWSHSQVSEALGKTPEATRALQHRALSNLRRILLKENPAGDGFEERNQDDL